MISGVTLACGLPELLHYSMRSNTAFIIKTMNSGALYLFTYINMYIFRVRSTSICGVPGHLHYSMWFTRTYTANTLPWAAIFISSKGWVRLG
jgi:hypothetical protein